MKLTLSHSDVISGICAFLADRGLTGFDPSKVHADFTKGRDGKLSVVLDDEAPVDAEPKQPKAKASPAVDKAAPVQTTDVAASGVKETPAVADVANAAAAEVPAGEAAAETAVAVETATAAEPAAAAGEENLFG